MKLRVRNRLGLAAAFLAFISVVFPWFDLVMWWPVPPNSIGGMSVLIYPWDAHLNGVAGSQPVNIELWYGWAALALIVIAGIVAIVGSITIGKIGKMILLVAGILALFSVIIFAIGLQGELSKGSVVPLFPKVNLFSKGSFMGVNYGSYLCVGFWIALATGIIAFISSRRHPMALSTSIAQTRAVEAS